MQFDFDIERDRSAIHEQYVKNEKANSLATLFPNVALLWDYEVNKSITPDMVSFSSQKKFGWICDKGHKWQASIANRIKGNGCPICSNKEILVGYNDLATTNPDLASEWHSTKNESLTSKDVTQSSHKKVWWQCRNGHTWNAVVANRNSGRGCPYCSNQKILVGYNDLATTNPKLASEWHPSENGELKPTDVIQNSHRRVKWVCKEKHVWESIIYNRTTGYGCPYCSGRLPIKGKTDLATVNPELARQWHPTRNGSLTPDQVTSGSDKKVWWICEKGHEWNATIGSRNMGCGCPLCAGRKKSASASILKPFCIEG